MLWPGIIVLFLDQASKCLILKTLPLYHSVNVIHGFFNIVHVRNRGMAFGLMNRSGMDFLFYVMVVASLGAIFLLTLWSLKLKAKDHRIILGLSLILGGAVGNLIDRFRFKEVIDFLDFYVGAFHWPAFNAADSAITLGTFWVAIHLLMQHRGSSPK